MSALSNVACSITPNPDMSGIGVRAAVYIQSILSFVPAIRALCDGKVTFTELKILEAQSVTILITALAVLISAAFQAHKDHNITSYDVLILVGLSWMNNTNLFIYLILYAFRRAHLTPQQKQDEGRSLEDVEWVARRPWISRVMEALKGFCFLVNKERATHEESGCQENVDESLEVDQETGNLDPAQVESGWLSILLKSPAIFIGSFHLSLISAINIWFFSRPFTFESSDLSSQSGLTIFVCGTSLLSGIWKIFAIVLYSTFLIPFLNLARPITWSTSPAYKNRSLVLGQLVMIGLIDCGIGYLTEGIISDNKHLVGPVEYNWTFGQILALLVLLVSFYNILQPFFGQDEQKRRFLLGAVNGAKGMVQVLLDLGANKCDLHALLRNRFKKGDWEMMQLLYENGANPDVPNKKGETAFILAARKECQNAIHVFVGQDIYVSKTDITKQIYLAAASEYMVSMKFLLKRHPNQASQALFPAVTEGKNEAVRLLLKHNVDVHVTNENGQTALFLAAEKGNNDVVKLLLEYDAKIDAQDKFKQTPLHLAAQSGHEKTVKLLVEEKANVHIKNNKNQTALYFAGSEGHKGIVKVLLQYNIDIHAKDIYGQTALHVAAGNGHQNIVYLFLEKNADINAKNKNEWNPLHLAAWKGQKNTVELLLHWNADVHIQDTNGQTALHLAAWAGHEETVNSLLRYNADINVKNQNKQTALHIAAKNGHFNVVKLLLLYNADVDVKDKNEQTALHLTVSNPFTGFVSEESGIVEVLLEYNADIHAKDKNQQTVLHVAIDAGNKDIVELLLQHNADVHAQDEHGQTPLHLAAAKGKKALLELLLNHKANMHTKNKEGQTAQDLARLQKYPDIAKFLAISECSEYSSSFLADYNL